MGKCIIEGYTPHKNMRFNSKTKIVEVYENWCHTSRIVESYASASMFAEIFLNNETIADSKRMTALYNYIEKQTA